MLVSLYSMFDDTDKCVVLIAFQGHIRWQLELTRDELFLPSLSVVESMRLFAFIYFAPVCNLHSSPNPYFLFCVLSWMDCMLNVPVFFFFFNLWMKTHMKLSPQSIQDFAGVFFFFLWLLWPKMLNSKINQSINFAENYLTW